MGELDRDSLAELLEQWLAIDSTSGEERDFLEALEEFFGADGWHVQRQDVEEERWNLLITDGHPTELLFSTHVDTVPPHLPVRRDNGVVWGRGACDTKGGLVAMWAASRRLREQGFRGIGFLLVVGEEVDHRGAKVARELSLQPERIILCEPTRNRVVRAQKGMLRCTLKSKGVAGHSAFPGDGESAIHPLLDAIEQLRRHPWPVDDILGPTTLNIGVIEGGVAANVFAPSAEAQILFRAVAPIEPMLEHLGDLVGDEVTIAECVYNDPVFFDPPADVATCTVPFNTDATYLAELGDVWLVGPGDIRCAHSDDEKIELDELFAGIQLYTELARRVLG